MIFMDPTVQTSSVFSAEWGWTPYTGGALLILSGLLCVLTGVSTRRSHTNGFGFKKAALFSFFALFFFFASWLVYVLNAWGTADVLYEAGHSVFAIDEFFGVYGTYTFWIWTILYCVVVPLTYASFVLTGQTCLARMSRLGVLGGGNGGQLPLLANAAPIGASEALCARLSLSLSLSLSYFRHPPPAPPSLSLPLSLLAGAAAWVQQANVNANAPVVVAVATAMPVAQPYGGAVDVTSPVPVAKAYAADTEDMVG